MNVDDDDKNDDVFTTTVERILSSNAPLTSKDLSDLTMLCSQPHNPLVSLGFSDVDPSLTGQLVEALQKLVTAASGVDLVKEGYQNVSNVSVVSLDSMFSLFSVLGSHPPFFS